MATHVERRLKLWRHAGLIRSEYIKYPLFPSSSGHASENSDKKNKDLTRPAGCRSLSCKARLAWKKAYHIYCARQLTTQMSEIMLDKAARDLSSLVEVLLVKTSETTLGNAICGLDSCSRNKRVCAKQSSSWPRLSWPKYS